MYQYCGYCQIQDAWFSGKNGMVKCDSCIEQPWRRASISNPWMDPHHQPNNLYTLTAFDQAMQAFNKHFLVSIKFNSVNKQWTTLAYEPHTLTYDSLHSLCSIPQLERY